MPHDPVRYSVAAKDAPALANVNGNFHDGDVGVLHSKPGLTYIFDSVSTAPVDNVNVIAGPSGKGRWVLDFYRARSTPLWYIRGQSGSDVTGDGSIDRPLQTISHALTLLGPAPVLLSSPTVTFDLGNEDLQPTDSPNFHGLAPAMPTPTGTVQVVIQGAKRIVIDGLRLTQVQAVNRAANLEPQIAAVLPSSNLSDWSGSRFQGLVVRSSVGATPVGATAVVFDDLGPAAGGARLARTGEFHTLKANGGVTQIDPLVGDVVAIYDRPIISGAMRYDSDVQLTLVDVTIAEDADPHIELHMAQVYFNDCWINGHLRSTAILGNSSIVLSGGYLHDAINTGSGPISVFGTVFESVAGSQYLSQGAMFAGRVGPHGTIQVMSPGEYCGIGDIWIFHANPANGAIWAETGGRILVQPDIAIGGDTHLADGSDGGSIFVVDSPGAYINIADPAKILTRPSASTKAINILGIAHDLADLTAGGTHGLWSPVAQAGITVGNGLGLVSIP